MSPMTKNKSSSVRRICSKRMKKTEIPKKQEVEEMKAKEVENTEEEEEPVVEDEEKEICSDNDEYEDFDLVTTKHVLEEILPARKHKKVPFFSSCLEKMRYDNLIPCDPKNDNQYKASWEKSVLVQRSLLRVTSDPRWKRAPAIIATIGPSCATENEIENLILSGMNIARINLAYGNRCDHLNMIRNIKAAARNFSLKTVFSSPIAIMLDLKGVQITTGKICKLYVKDCENPQIFLAKNGTVTLTSNKHMINKVSPKLIYINYESLPKLVRPGMKIYLDDGAVKLIVQKIEKDDVVCTVDEEGSIGNNRPVYLPMVSMMVPAYTSNDEEDIIMGIDEEVDVLTLPRAQDPKDLQNLREKLTEMLLMTRPARERPILLFAKISTFQGLRNIDQIIEVADGIVIQRGDLMLDLPMEKMHIAQKEIIAKCNLAGKPVICSTQLMHSMLNKIQISRSDVSDVAGCIYDGADCISLTSETANGKYPCEAVEMAGNIIREADAATYQRNYYRDIMDRLNPPTDSKLAIAMAACIVAEKVRAPAIIVLTTSGKSAALISWFRPRIPVLAITCYERTARQLNLWRCIIPIHYKAPCPVDWFMNMERKFQYGIAYGKESGFIRFGDPLVLVSGYGKDIGYTNCVRVVYASTEPDVYLEHSKEFYSNLYAQKDIKRIQGDKLPFELCK